MYRIAKLPVATHASLKHSVPHRDFQISIVIDHNLTLARLVGNPLGYSYFSFDDPERTPCRSVLPPAMAVPQEAKHAVPLKVADLYEHRGGAGGIDRNISEAVESLLWPDRVRILRHCEFTLDDFQSIEVRNGRHDRQRTSRQLKAHLNPRNPIA